MQVYFLFKNINVFYGLGYIINENKYHYKKCSYTILPVE